MSEVIEVALDSVSRGLQYVSLDSARISEVEELPAGKVCVIMENGNDYRVLEPYAHVVKKWNQAKKRGGGNGDEERREAICE